MGLSLSPTPVPAASPLLVVEGLCKSFGHVVTARDVGFEVAAGTALGVVGPNGAGKSTLLSLVTGALPVDGGRIRFAGEDVTGVPTGALSRRGIARTFQIPRPFTDMTVYENVYAGATFGGGLQGSSAVDVALDALERTGLLGLANQRAGRLRLLDRKRLEVARALATGPRLLLLDEIAGGLTDQELPPVVELVRSLRDSGIAVVWIEHIVHALTSVVDRLMCLAGGRILAIGDPHEVLASPEVVEVYLGTTFEKAGAV